MADQGYSCRHPAPTLMEADPARLAWQLDQKGIAVLENCFSARQIEEAAGQVHQILIESGNEYVGLSGNEGMRGDILASLEKSPDFRLLCSRICRARGQAAANPSVKQVLRCLTGPTGIQQSGYFHFDSYVITAIIPIIMPDAEPCGDLLFFHGMRRHSTNYIINIIQKAILELKPVQALFRWAFRRGLATRVRMKTGSIYLLDGARALHANEACDPAAIRATLVIHFAETHGEHWLKRRQIRRRTARLAAASKA